MGSNAAYTRGIERCGNFIRQTDRAAGGLKVNRETDVSPEPTWLTLELTATDVSLHSVSEG